MIGHWRLSRPGQPARQRRMLHILRCRYRPTTGRPRRGTSGRFPEGTGFRPMASWKTSFLQDSVPTDDDAGFGPLGVSRPNRSCNPRNLLTCVTRLSCSSGPGARDMPMQPNPRNHRAEGAATIRSCIERGAASDVFHVRGSGAMRVAAMLADMAACASGCRDPDPLPEDLGRGAGSEPIRDISRQSRVVNGQDGGLECRAVAGSPPAATGGETAGRLTSRGGCWAWRAPCILVRLGGGFPGGLARRTAASGLPEASSPSRWPVLPDALPGRFRARLRSAGRLHSGREFHVKAVDESPVKARSGTRRRNPDASSIRSGCQNPALTLGCVSLDEVTERVPCLPRFAWCGLQ